MFIVIATVLLLVIQQGECVMNATAHLHPHASVVNLGKLVFTQESADAPVRITGSVVGLNASSAHGFHIHVDPVEENSPNCTAAGPHFNPYNVLHGPPSANLTSRHVGDLGNITTDADGKLELDIEDSIIQLYNLTQSILNRAVVIHLLRDDGGEGGFNDSTTTGNAGARIICGVIKLSWEDPTTTSSTPMSTTSVSSTEAPSSSTSNSSTETPTPWPSTSTSSSETPTTSSLTPSVSTPSTPATTPSAGLNIQPAMFILIITAIVGYIVHY